MNIYFDNAATTPLDPDVFEAMKPFFLQDFGNPSSTHAHGRKARAAIESGRKTVAALLNCTPGEIIFTSGGTEAINCILAGAVKAYTPSAIITSRVEHHAVLHTAEQLNTHAKIEYVNLDDRGNVDLDHLQQLLRENHGALVSLMQANNEIGNLLDIHHVGELCAAAGAYFHSDTVQAVGHYRHDLKHTPVHGITAAAHKFHGPKGVGFMYVKRDKKIGPYIFGGGQERNNRGGTENVAGIIGLCKALEIAYSNLDDHTAYIRNLKSRMIARLKEGIPDVSFNGNSEDLDKSLYTILNVSLPESDENDMLLFNLDLIGISASGGSACSSGASTGSHVLQALNPDEQRGAIRFSFSKFNTIEEVDFVVDKLTERFSVIG
ncbi:MAG TPA: cysteine desulfurase family protein, partial [Cyclobacteriaceae bacterium]|nr:cysteine desulfurase family protein [Cyclobacteriaceae bacterium]